MGALVGGLIGGYFTDRLGVGDSLWRYAIGLGAIPAAIVLVLRFFYTSESPMWSAAHEGLDHAAEIIKKTYLRQWTWRCFLGHACLLQPAEPGRVDVSWGGNETRSVPDYGGMGRGRSGFSGPEAVR